MTKRRKILLFSVLLSASVYQAGWARINLLEPWFPGQDTKIAEETSSQFIASFISGDELWELPLQYSIVPGPKYEIGARWSLKSVAGRAGISDILLGAKFKLMDETSSKPSIIGETALSLPSGDYTRGLGTGGIGLLLNWALEKKLRRYTGYLGLGIQLNTENPDRVQQGNTFFYHFGASWPYRELFRLHAEFKGFMHSPLKAQGVSVGSTVQEFYLAPGLNYKLDARHTLSCSVLIGMTPESDRLGLIGSI